MRISSIIIGLQICFSSILLAHFSYAQSITIHAKNATVIEVIAQIEKQSKIKFSYSTETLKDVGTITLNLERKPLLYVLQELEKNTPLIFKRIGNFVGINRKLSIEKSKTVPLQINAQPTNKPKDIKGKVLDENNQPLTGASVRIKGTAIVTQTDENGKFSLTAVAESAILQISFLGYKLKEIQAVEDLIIILQRVSSQLEEVGIVSTGYQDIPKERATGSFTLIDSKTIARSPAVNILDRLEGVASGLLLNRNLTNSANNPKISIRGRSTIFANAEPLIVLDGLPYEGSIDQINGNDIETINLLKDAAAASIWGTRASNGVIVITSKKGSYNKKPEINFTSTITQVDKPDLHYLSGLSSSDYIDVEQFLFSKDYYFASFFNKFSPISGAVDIFDQRKRNLISAADSAARIDALKAHDVRDDLSKHMYRKASLQQYQLNVRGGGEFNKYYISGGLDRNFENKVTDNYRRYTLNANNTYSLLKERVIVTTGVNYNSSETKSQATDYSPYTPYDRWTDENGNSLHVMYYGSLRTSYVDTVANGKLLDWHFNPKDDLSSNVTKKNTQYKIDLGLDIKIIEGLNLTANYQYLKQLNEGLVYDKSDSYYVRNLVNSYSKIVNNVVQPAIPYGDISSNSQTTLNSKIIRTQLNFSKTFHEDHNINAIAGYEGTDSRISTLGQTAYGFDPAIKTNGNNKINPMTDYPLFYETFRTSRFSTSPYQTELINIAQSFYANASYSYKSKYILSGSVRKDESNLFGVNANQKGVPLWSSGLAWIINKENFYAINWLKDLKLRGSYGYNGNVDKTLSALLTVTRIGLTNAYGDIYSQVKNPPNPDLRWEKVKVWNVGLDFALTNGRISGGIDIYRKNAVDLIGNTPISSQTGVTVFRGNGASLISKGIDVVINSRNIQGAFNWISSLNVNVNTDKVSSYKTLPTRNLDLIDGNFNNPQEGYPYYAVFSFPSQGLNEMGMPKGFFNGESSTDYSSIITKYDPTQLKFHGSASPKYFGNFLNTFSYRSFELSMNINYKFDYFFRRSNVFGGFDVNWISRVADYEKRWQKPGDELITTVPGFKYPDDGSMGTFFRASESVVEPGDHIRLQDIRLSYNFQESLRMSKFKNLSLFLYARNLGIIWKKSNTAVDPDYGSYSIPQPFALSLGLNLTL